MMRHTADDANNAFISAIKAAYIKHRYEIACRYDDEKHPLAAVTCIAWDDKTHPMHTAYVAGNDAIVDMTRDLLEHVMPASDIDHFLKTIYDN